MLVFTVCHPSQLSNAHVLGDSLMSSNPEVEFLIGLCGDVNINTKFKIVELPKLIPNFKDLALKFDESELLSVCKTFLFKNLIDDNYSDNYIFFDCQSVVLQSLDCIAAEFANNNLLITPQILHSSVHPDEKQILNSGIFHAGFIGVNNSEESKKFINWWYANTFKKGYRSLCKGLNQDQLWLELAPTLFEGVKIIKLDGLNIGKWNHLERML
ncbi:MAG: hypothetical protein MUF45_12565, partial [Spirosomaceae bacterium]|nr:hypothetical protein [Spirosomataceae bacterium]